MKRFWKSIGCCEGFQCECGSRSPSGDSIDGHFQCNRMREKLDGLCLFGLWENCLNPNLRPEGPQGLSPGRGGFTSLPGVNVENDQEP